MTSFFSLVGRVRRQSGRATADAAETPPLMVDLRPGTEIEVLQWEPSLRGGWYPAVVKHLHQTHTVLVEYHAKVANDESASVNAELLRGWAPRECVRLRQKEATAPFKRGDLRVGTRCEVAMRNGSWCATCVAPPNSRGSLRVRLIASDEEVTVRTEHVRRPSEPTSDELLRALKSGAPPAATSSSQALRASNATAEGEDARVPAWAAVGCEVELHETAAGFEGGIAAGEGMHPKSSNRELRLSLGPCPPTEHTPRPSIRPYAPREPIPTTHSRARPLRSSRVAR